MKWALLGITMLAVAGAAGSALAQEADMLAVLETGHGSIVIEFFPGDAPNHVENFVSLAESGFYDGTLFHRIIPGFMIQGGDPNTIDGDPTTWGTGGPDTNVDAEFNTIRHERGIVSMARSQSPDSASSQFFIVHAPSNFLDGQYTAFGRVVTAESLETLDRIAASETSARDVPADPESVRIASITIVDRSDVDGLLDLDEPERTGPAPDPVSGQPAADPGTTPFESDELGIAFEVLGGWQLRQFDEEGSPDLALLGPILNGVFPPQIAIVMENHTKTFDEIVSETDARLDEFVESANLGIISQERDTVNGIQAYSVVTDNAFLTQSGPINVQFNEVTLYAPEKIYKVTYVNDVNFYDDQKPAFDLVLQSVSILDDGPVDTEPADAPASTDGGGCLIATAAYGTELAPQVQQLRELRDSTVLSTESGSSFMGAFNEFYYSFSPAVADIQRENPAFRDIVRALITPMLASLSILNHAGIDSEAEMVSYGAGIILLNVGMYVAAPAVAIRGIKRAIAS